jgi:O-acetyl-ADP-ribose deacetylase (regulator of RNase III)
MGIEREPNRLAHKICVSATQTIQIRQADITEEHVDVIVNAANGQLAHGGGIAGVIAKKAGPPLEEESRRWIDTHGPIATGNVAVTGPGRLACQKVIHAVGPVWHGGDRGEPALLGAAVLNSLIKADELGLQSIAIPAISSGIFGFPKELCAEISLRTAIRFYKQRPGSSIRLIRFTNVDTETVSIFYKIAITLGSAEAAEEV